MNSNLYDIILDGKRIFKEYNPSMEWQVGDLCFIDRKLYECTYIHKSTTPSMDYWVDPKRDDYVTITGNTVEIFDQKHEEDTTSRNGNVKFQVTFPYNAINQLVVRVYNIEGNDLIASANVGIIEDTFLDSTVLKTLNEDYLVLSEIFDKDASSNAKCMTIESKCDIPTRIEIFHDKNTTIEVMDLDSIDSNNKAFTQTLPHKIQMETYTTTLCTFAKLASSLDINSIPAKNIIEVLSSYDNLSEQYKKLLDDERLSIEHRINLLDITLSSIDDKISLFNKYISGDLPSIDGDINDKGDRINSLFNRTYRDKNTNLHVISKLLADKIDVNPSTIGDNTSIDTIELSTNNLTLNVVNKDIYNINNVYKYQTMEKCLKVKSYLNHLFVLESISGQLRISKFGSKGGVYNEQVDSTNISSEVISNVDNMWMINDKYCLLFDSNSSYAVIYDIYSYTPDNRETIITNGIRFIDFNSNYLVILKDIYMYLYEVNGNEFNLLDKAEHGYNIFNLKDVKICPNTNSSIWPNILFIESSNRMIALDIKTKTTHPISDTFITDYSVSSNGIIFTIEYDSLSDIGSNDGIVKLCVYRSANLNISKMSEEYLSFDPLFIKISPSGTHILVAGENRSRFYSYNKYFNVINKLESPNITCSLLSSDTFEFIGEGNLYVYGYPYHVNYGYINKYLPSVNGLSGKNIITVKGNTQKCYWVLVKNDDLDYTFLSYEFNKNVFILTNSVTVTTRSEIYDFGATNTSVVYIDTDSSKDYINCIDFTSGVVSSSTELSVRCKSYNPDDNCLVFSSNIFYIFTTDNSIYTAKATISDNEILLSDSTNNGWSGSTDPRLFTGYNGSCIIQFLSEGVFKETTIDGASVYMFKTSTLDKISTVNGTTYVSSVYDMPVIYSIAEGKLYCDIISSINIGEGSVAYHTSCDLGKIPLKVFAIYDSGYTNNIPICKFIVYYGENDIELITARGVNNDIMTNVSKTNLSGYIDSVDFTIPYTQNNRGVFIARNTQPCLFRIQ